MNEHENFSQLEKIAAQKQLIRYIVVCRRGSEPFDPRGVVDECFTCDYKILCSPVSVEKKKDGFLLMCRNCFEKLVRKCNAKGVPIQFGGRVSNDKLPGGMQG